MKYLKIGLYVLLFAILGLSLRCTEEVVQPVVYITEYDTVYINTEVPITIIETDTIFYVPYFVVNLYEDTCRIDSSYYWWIGDPYQPGDTLRIFIGCGEPDSIFPIYIPPGGPYGRPGSVEFDDWWNKWLEENSD